MIEKGDDSITNDDRERVFTPQRVEFTTRQTMLKG